MGLVFMLPKLDSSNASLIENPEEFFSLLGNLHDSHVNFLEWNPIRNELAISVDDIHSNFFNPPEHPGLQPARFIAVGLINLVVDVSPGKYPAFVLSFEVSRSVNDSMLSVIVNCGDGQLKFECREIYGQASMP